MSSVAPWRIGELVPHVISLALARQLEQPSGYRSPQVLMALPTQGRVLLDTTAGDIDIELWSKVRDATMSRYWLVQIRVCRKHLKHAGIS